MFYILDGALRILSGTELIRAETGDVVVVPHRMAHTFAAERGKSAELLIIIAPGVERFGYFRQLTRIARGEQPPESHSNVQDLYDTYFMKSSVWEVEQHR
jgi:hypothetical protein